MKIGMVDEVLNVMHILWNMPEQVTFQVDAMSKLFRTISTCLELRCESRALISRRPALREEMHRIRDE